MRAVQLGEGELTELREGNELAASLSRFVDPVDSPTDGFLQVEPAGFSVDGSGLVLLENGSHCDCLRRIQLVLINVKTKLKFTELMMSLRNPFPFQPYILFHPHPVHTQPSFHPALPGSVSASFSSPHQFTVSSISKIQRQGVSSPHGPKMQYNRMMPGVCSRRRDIHSTGIQGRQSAGFGDEIAFISTDLREPGIWKSA